MLHTLLFCAIALAPADVAKLAKHYTDSVHQLNEKHARDPGKEGEQELARKLPADAQKALEQLLAEKSSPELERALEDCSEAALDLDRLEDFQKIRARRLKDTPGDAAKLDTALSRPRFVLRGVGGLDEDYLKSFAEVLEGVLGAYDEVFGFAEFSKVPGKKLRVRLRLVDKITAPPHFGPEFPYHSEIDFPVIDAHELASPTADGKFLFYGLCHELGHVIAMWDTPGKQEDFHTWAHYCGVTIVEHLAQQKSPPKWLKKLRDAQWRSLAKEREAAKEHKPGLDSDKAVMATWIALHDRVGPKVLAAAMNEMDAKEECSRVNRVRYYTFKAFKKALLREVGKDEVKRKAVEELFR
ncbi:MAG: hypothetical protein IPJ19_07925 [Planctomycetes bacterium]|nr:hypothetical protein [Planctomycetota bacterium]